VGRARPPAHPDAKFAACACADPPDPAVRDSHAVSDLELGGHTTLAAKEGRLPLSNGMEISCKPSSRRPHNSTFRWAPSAASARAELGTVRLVGCISGLGVRPGSIRGGPAPTVAPREATRSVGRRRRDRAAVRQGGLRVPAALAELRPAGLDGRQTLRTHRQDERTPSRCACTPNDRLISCKRPVRTYGPLSPLGGPDADGARRRPRLSAALAG